VEGETLDLRADKSLLLGHLISEVQNLRRENSDEHLKIFARLDESDKYIAILKISRCALSGLDKYGLVKAAIIAAISGFVGFQIAC